MLNRIDFSKKVVEMKNITKKFGNFVANDNINLTIHKGEVHALLGENGAGKSTLMNILYGLYQPTSGEIFIKGEKCKISNPKVAISKGIGMVHQHFMLVKPFTVYENIILGNEPVSFLGKIDKEKAINEVKILSDKYGLYINPLDKIQDISVGMEQRVEILKALYRGAEILILDEPTAVLTPQEIKELITIINNLTLEGKSVILISHKLSEIKSVADYCTIIRHGKHIDTLDVKLTSEEELASKMVGRKVSFKVEKKEKEKGKKILEINNLKVKDNRDLFAVNDLSLDIYSGEIVGLAGVDGNGQSELIECLIGLREAIAGNIKINGIDITNKTPKQIIENKIGTIPEDRQKWGLVLDFSVAENIILKNEAKEPFSKKGIFNFFEIKKFASDLVNKFDIRPPDIEKATRDLSGGNQQKVIIAREITNNPDLLIAAQPTRGLDIGAIEYVHKAIVEQRDNGKAILLVSFELDEILNLSDRIAVIYRGRIVDIFENKNVDIDKIGLMMTGSWNEKK